MKYDTIIMVIYMELLYIILVVVIIVLISVNSNKNNENLKLMVDNYWEEYEQKYKRVSTKKLQKRLSELNNEYNSVLDNKKRLCRKDRSYGRFEEDKLISDAENYMCYDKNTMKLYVEYNVIESILRDRDALEDFDF